MEVDGFPPRHLTSPWDLGMWIIVMVGNRVFHWLQGRQVLDWSFACISGAFMLGVGFKKMSSKYPDRKDHFLVLSFLLTGLLAPQLILGSSDIAFQHRAFGMYAILWRVLLPSFFETLRECIFAEILLLINELRTTQQCFAEGGADMPIRVLLVLLWMTGVFTSFYKSLHMHWKSLRTMQWELSEEQKAQETLISMLCSSCAHIGRDGNTIIRSSAQLDKMIGESVKDSKLKRFLANDEAELARVENAFSQARVSPVTLPMTLFSARGTHNLDVFIVRRRTIEPGEEMVDLGFLLGFRFSHDGMEDLINASEFQDCFHMQAVELNKKQFDVSAASDWVSETPSETVLRSSHAAKQPSPEPVLPGCQTATGQQPAFAWCDESALPKPLTEFSPGGRVLCYDNVARGLTFARITNVVTGKENSNSDWVTIGFEDDSCIKVKADHPVAIQDIEDHSCVLQSRRRCVLAAELQAGQHTLLAVRILPMLVTRVEHNSEMTEMPRDQQCFAVSVEHPERYEPLGASFDKEESIRHPIAISSYDRWINSVSMNTKNTFVCLRDDHKPQESRSVRSAPPSVQGGAPHGLGTREVGHNRGRFSLDRGLNALGLDVASSLSSSKIDSAVSLGTGMSSDWELAVMSSQCSSISGSDFIRLGAAAEEVRLTDLLYLKTSGSASIGSICINHKTCRPCSFHFTHCKYPDRRLPCKAGSLCDYCHDPVHNEQWRSKLRKCRSAQPVKLTSLS